MTVPTLPGVSAHTIKTTRLRTRVLFTGPKDGTPVLFLHGNASSATFWEGVMLALPAGYRGIAPDQRGYGGADPDKKIDATGGLRDWAEDALALMDHLSLEQVHIVGHSLGGAVVWRLMMDAPARLRTVTQVAPGSPFGFGGSKDLAGTPCYEDCAGSGGGIVNPEFARLIGEGNRDADNPQASPRVVMNTFYWKPPFVPEREEDLLSSLLSEHVGPQAYPGDMVQSPNWPLAAPGAWGPINAVAPCYADDVQRLYDASPKPPVLWVRGSHDQIVADKSLFDVGTLGEMGAIPGWPGADVFPSQPMVSQTRAVLEQYAAAGGSFEEVVIEDTGHTPYVEKPDEFNRIFHKHIG